MGMDDVPRCQHIKMNGTQCGSPALRWRRLCFFHDRIKCERAKIARDMTAQRRFDLPLLEDANSVQVALMKVMQMLGSGRMDHRTAGLMLYALQTASVNLRHADFEADEATDVVIDRDDVHRSSIGGPQWFEEDFEHGTKADEDEESAGKTGTEPGTETVEAKQGEEIQAQICAGKPGVPEEVSLAQARRDVREHVENWVVETVLAAVARQPHHRSAG
jgi:hypothetical protein